MTDKERYEFVSQTWMNCVKPITNVRKGKGCEVGQAYLFEYVHDTEDGENPCADSFYRKLSDNDHYDEVYITDEELHENFIVIEAWQPEPDVYKQAFEIYGMDKNCGFLMEECGELLSAVNKFRRDRADEDAVIEELADVYLVVRAFAVHLGYDKFLLWVSRKQRRLMETLKGLQDENDRSMTPPVEWSEEDEDVMNTLIKYLTQECDKTPIPEDKEMFEREISMLKSIKDRVQPQSQQEWSEEDEERLSDAIFFVREYQIPTRDKRLLNAAKETEDWLRNFQDKVQPQNTWKPSDEQMERLKGTINSLPHQKVLYSLYQDLLKLKG